MNIVLVCTSAIKLCVDTSPANTDAYRICAAFQVEAPCKAFLRARIP